MSCIVFVCAYLGEKLYSVLGKRDLGSWGFCLSGSAINTPWLVAWLVTHASILNPQPDMLPEVESGAGVRPA